MAVRSGALRSDTSLNSRFRVAVGDDGGHGARLAERLSELSNTGGWWGRWWLTKAKRQRSDLTRLRVKARNDKGLVVGGDGGIECVGLSRRGKSACGL